MWRSGATNDPENGSWPRLTPTQALGPRLVATAFVVLGMLNFLMILGTFKKYSKNGWSLTEPPGSHQSPEGDRTTRGRGLSRKTPMEPQVSLPIGEGSSSAGLDVLEKSGVEQRVSAKV